MLYFTLITALNIIYIFAYYNNERVILPHLVLMVMFSHEKVILSASSMTEADRSKLILVSRPFEATTVLPLRWRTCKTRA